MIFVGAIPKIDNSVYLSSKLPKYDIPSLALPLDYYSLFIRALYLDGHITHQSVESLLSLEHDLREYGSILNLEVLESITPSPLHRVMRRLRSFFFGRGGEMLPVIPGLEHVSLVSLLSLLSLEEARVENVVLDVRPLKGHYEIPFNLSLLRSVVNALDTRFSTHLVVDSIYSLNDLTVISPKADRTGIRVLMSRPKFCRDLRPNDLVYIEKCLPERKPVEVKWMENGHCVPLYRDPDPIDYVGLIFKEHSEGVRDILDELFEVGCMAERTFYERIIEEVDKRKWIARGILYKLYRYGFVELVQSPGGRIVVLSSKGMEAVISYEEEKKRSKSTEEGS